MKEKIAIIGMGCVFPGALDFTQYWQNIVEGKDCIKKVEPDFWKLEEFYDPDPSVPGKSYCKMGGQSGPVEFDTKEFGISPKVMEHTAVDQLFGLIVARQALIDAGYYGKNARPFNRENTGVIMSAGTASHVFSLHVRTQRYKIKEILVNNGVPEAAADMIVAKFLETQHEWSEDDNPGYIPNVVAGRIANRFDLGGTSCSVDAACGASLGAVKFAVDELQNHNMDMMLVGGANLDNSPVTYLSFTKTPACSKTGKIRPFDANADGMIIGDGVGIMVLKPDWKGLVFFATFLDGKMGFTGESEHYAYGTFNGVAKSLSIEFGQQAAVKIIDFQPDVTPAAMAELMDDELCIHDVWPEIGRTNDGKRWTCTGTFTDARVRENRCPYTPEDVLVVTGGSRGVTSKCLMALMEKAPCKVAILGRAAINPEHMDDAETAQIPDLKEMKTLIARRFKAEGYKGPFSTIEKKAKAILDQRDMLNTFNTLEKIGCTVRYYPCDVNNQDSLKQTMQQIEQELGAVRGIIHGAGLLADCKIWNKEMARFRAVLDTKYVGLNNLLSCVDKEQLKLVVSFSSVAGYFGNDGQMDYAAGNEFLAKFSHHFRKKYPNCKALTINWGAWDGGMMDYIYRKTLTEKGYVLIPLDVGANYFANEFLNGLPSGQILISNNDKPVDLTRPAE